MFQRNLAEQARPASHSSRTSLVCQHVFAPVQTAVACSSNTGASSASSLISDRQNRSVPYVISNSPSKLLSSLLPLPSLGRAAECNKYRSCNVISSMCSSGMGDAGRPLRRAPRAAFQSFAFATLSPAQPARYQAQAYSPAAPPSYGGEHRSPASFCIPQIYPARSSARTDNHHNLGKDRCM